MSLKNKILLMVSIGCLICTLSAMLVSSYQASRSGQNALIDKSRAILSRLEAVREYVAKQGGLKTAIDRARSLFPNGELPPAEKEIILNQVPIYAALKTGAEKAERDAYEFRVASHRARQQKNLATDKEKSFLDEFNRNPELSELTYNDLESNQIWVMRPVRISEAQGCLNCHGNPAQSPWGNGKDVLGYPMEDWADGYLHALFIIKSDLGPVQAAVTASNTQVGIWGLTITILVLGVLYVLLQKPFEFLKKISTELTSSSQTNLNSAEELKTAADSVASSSTEQAAAIQETVASMAEMTSMISRTAELAKQTDDLTQRLATTSQNGQNNMAKMMESIEGIKQANSKISQVVEAIRSISSKTKIINDIVFKTQLLSVNASIEAARAGQHGRGFAVVADEVGKLAELSGKAAEEIRTLISQGEKTAAEVVRDTHSRVDLGEGHSQMVLEQFNEIAKGIAEIKKQTQQVNEATVQQKEGINQVYAAMNEMEATSRENTQRSVEAGVQSERLKDLSHHTQILNEQLAQLVIGNQNQGPSEIDAANHSSPTNTYPSKNLSRAA